MRYDIDNARITYLPLHERVEIAMQRGDDVLFAVVDDTYGNGGCRMIGADKLVESIYAAAAKAKNGTEKDRLEFRCLMLMLCGAEGYEFYARLHAQRKAAVIGS